MTRDRLGIDARLLAAPGIGTYVQEVVARLPALLPSADITLLVDANAALPEVFADGPFEILRTPVAVYAPHEHLAVPWRLRRSDLVWVPHYNAPVIGGRPFVLTVHDVVHVAQPDLFGHRRSQLAAIVLARAVKRAQHVMFDSEFTAAEVARLVGQPSSSSVVPLGAPDVDPAPLTRGQRHGLLYVGSAKPHKNVGVLVDAVTILRGRGVDVELTIAGKGWTEREIGTVARAGVRCAGEVDGVSLDRLYREAIAVVHPSRYEGFGLTPLEAMARSTPVVTTRCGSLPEVCGDAALYVDEPDRADRMADTISSLLDDGARWTKLASAGRDRATTFTWDACAASVAEVLSRSRSNRPTQPQNTNGIGTRRKNESTTA